MRRTTRLTKWPRSTASALLVLGACALIACGGGTTAKLADATSEPPTEAVPTPTPITARVTAGDLALMVLPLPAYGGRYATFQVSANSGARDNQAEAATSTDPRAALADYDRLGRVTGYRLSFYPLTYPLQGVRFLESKVDLWRDDGAAHADLLRELRLFDNAKGQRDGQDLLTGFVQFPVAGLGDEAVNIVSSITNDAIGPKTITDVLFRIGRVVAWVTIIRNDGVDSTGEVVTLARSLDTRIRAELRGEIRDSVVPFPPSTPTPAIRIAPPPGVPDLASAALRVEDLPKGYLLWRQGYLPAQSNLETEFHVNSGDPMLGTSHLSSIVEELFAQPNVSAAQNGVTAVTAEYLGEKGKKTWASLFEKIPGADLSAMVIREQAISVGDISRGVTVTLSYPGGSLTEVFVAFSVGKVTGILFIAVPGAGYKFDDLVPLAKAAASRITAAKLP